MKRCNFELPSVLFGAVLGLGMAGCSPILPPIMQDIQGKGAYLEKLSALYPIGSRSDNLAKELEDQGFTITKRRWYDRKSWDEDGIVYDAMKSLWGSIIPCTAVISWRPDAKENIKEFVRADVGCASP